MFYFVDIVVWTVSGSGAILSGLSGSGVILSGL